MVSEELASLAALYALRSRTTVVRKDRRGPPKELELDGVWCQDASWCDDGERRAEIADILAKQGNPLKAFWVKDYEAKASKYWEAFYKRNEDRFFKDRHYVDAEFGDAFRKGALSHVVELGCGVGNGALPLLGTFSGRLTCVDFSSKAIELLRGRPEFDAERCRGLVRDLVKDGLDDVGSADVVTCFFVLSALSPETLPSVCAKIAGLLREKGGSVLVRDYGRYDEAQLRFSKNHKLAPNFYVKADGTRCFYFDLPDLDRLFQGLGFSGSAHFKFQRHLNRHTAVSRRRVFIQALYELRPLDQSR
mmetsp:Transcript_7911/g.24413  ORF Transcript_7911/g.24413 Transcript_7911/m.24413 type:complete len:305 (+) Transcript_7911:42-956(+)